MRWAWLSLVWAWVLFGADFDCAFVGTSPIPLFEALYQRACGKKVLIVEQDDVCGGAWRGIAICGMEHVDLGCHQIGYTPELKEFLEVYGGCRVVPIDNPKGETFSGQGLYFAKGCYELIDHLVQMAERLGIEVRLGCQLKSVQVDRDELILNVGDATVTAAKLFYTPLTPFTIENPPDSMKVSKRRPRYYHLYLLIQDPTAPQFSYRACHFGGASRMMNLTYFLGLEPLGRQMIVFQLNTEGEVEDGEKLLQELKIKNLISPSAYLLRVEPYVYETGSAPQRIPTEWQHLFHKLQTAGFLSITTHIPRWKKVLQPFREIIP